MSRKIEVGWMWVVAATVGWPLLHVVVFTVRFGEIPVGEAMRQLPLFAPTGFAAAMIVRILVRRADPGTPQWPIVLGVVGSLPFAALGNIMGGLLGPIGVTAFGVLPLVIGAGAGWTVGKLLPRSG